MLSLDDLRKDAESGTIDTVVTAFSGMQGRLVGKRIQADYFLDQVIDHGIDDCNYLLALAIRTPRARALPRRGRGSGSPLGDGGCHLPSWEVAAARARRRGRPQAGRPCRSRPGQVVVPTIGRSRADRDDELPGKPQA
jgi:hypothetical protein